MAALETKELRYQSTSAYLRYSELNAAFMSRYNVVFTGLL